MGTIRDGYREAKAAADAKQAAEKARRQAESKARVAEYEARMEVLKQTDPAAHRREQRKLSAIVGTLAAGVLGLLVWGLVAMFSGGEDRPTYTPPPSTTSDTIEARLVCKDFVKQRLKSPKSADFSGEQAQALGANAYRVTGNVDAENSFGANLRSRWVCAVTLVGNTWKLNNLVIE